MELGVLAQSTRGGEALASDPGGIVRSEKYGHLGDIVGLTHTRERRALDYLLFKIAADDTDPVRAFRLDAARIE
jgi:hypothetical protein